MERTLGIIGISYLLGTAVALIFGLDKFVILSIILIIAFFLSVVSKKLRKDGRIPIIFITAFLAVIMLSGYTNAFVKPSEYLNGETAEITAELCELPYRQNDHYYYKLKTSSIDIPNVNQKVTVLVSSRYKIDIEPYDTIKMTVRFYSETDSSQKLYNISKGITARGSIDLLKSRKIIKSEDKPLYYYALKLRQYISDTVKIILPKREADFVRALLTGSKYQLEEEEKENLRVSGLSHIVAVSGFHLSLITQLMFTFLKVITGGNKKFSAFLCIVCVFAYMAVAGFSTSILRAGIMQILILLGMVADRKSDSLNSLGLSAVIICFINPYSVTDASFLLSFSATFGIVTSSSKLNDFIKEYIQPKKLSQARVKFIKNVRLKRLLKSVISIVSVSLSAYIFTLPVIIVFFKQIAVYSVISNVLTSWAVSLILPVSIFMIILYAGNILPFALFMSSFVCKPLTDYVLQTAESIANLPFSTITSAQEFIPYWLTGMILIEIFVYLSKSKKRLMKYYAIFAVITFIGGNLYDGIIKSGSTKISVLDVGQGISLVVTHKDNIYLLSCGGSYYKSHSVNEYLKNSGAEEITYMLLSDDKSSLTGYAKSVLEKYSVKAVQVYDEEDYTENLKLLIKDSKQEISVSSDENPMNTVYIDDICIRTLKNEHCTAVRIEFDNIKLLMCSEKTDYAEIPEKWSDNDFLVVSGEQKNIELLTSRYLIISDEYDNLTDYEPFTLSEYGKIYATADKGDISVRVYRNGEISIRRENGWLS